MIVARARIVAAVAALAASTALAALGGDPASANSPSTAPTFSDVSTTNPFYGDITYLVNQKIARGYADDTFRPTAPVTRQAVAAFLYRYEHPTTTAPACTTPPFSDVPISRPFCGDIAALKAEDVLAGFGDGTFGPTGVVTRQALAAFLHKIANTGKTRPACSSSPFPDVPTSSPFCGAISALAASKVITGYSDGSFKPTAVVTREAVAAFLHRQSQAATTSATSSSTPPTSSSGGTSTGGASTGGSSTDQQNTIVPSTDTTTVAPDELVAVSGDPDGTQKITLSGAAADVQPGGYLVSAPTTSAPNGLLAQVVSVTSNPDGSVVATTQPATLDEAYSTFNIHDDTDLSPDDVSIIPNATHQARRAVVRRAAATPGFSLSPAAADFTCTGTSTPSITLTADLTKIHVTLDLDADPAYPNIDFLMTAYPVFSINFSFSGEITCSLNGSIKATIPIPAAPALDVTVKPVFTLHADGQVSATDSWSPHMVVGFQRAPGISTNTHTFGSSAGATVTGTASASAYLGVSIGLELAGRAGVTGDAGPELTADYSTTDQCITVNGDIKVNLQAEADVFVRHWDFNLFSGRFDSVQVYHHCAGGTGGTGTGGTGTGGTGTGGTGGTGTGGTGTGGTGTGGTAGTGTGGTGETLRMALQPASGAAGVVLRASSIDPCPVTFDGSKFDGVYFHVSWKTNDGISGGYSGGGFEGWQYNSDGSWIVVGLPTFRNTSSGKDLPAEVLTPRKVTVKAVCEYEGIYDDARAGVSTYEATFQAGNPAQFAAVHNAANDSYAISQINPCPIGSDNVFGYLASDDGWSYDLTSRAVGPDGQWDPFTINTTDTPVEGHAITAIELVCSERFKNSYSSTLSYNPLSISR